VDGAENGIEASERNDVLTTGFRDDKHALATTSAGGNGCPERVEPVS
jgi:hypothetical protein